MSDGKILIVEDDTDQLVSMAALLRTEGYEVLAAGEGLTAIREATNESPDLIVLDLGLPAGDGFWVLKQLKSTWSLAQIPVIVVTARDTELTRQQAFEAGADGFGLKPVEPAVLLASIDQLLAGGGPAAASASD